MEKKTIEMKMDQSVVDYLEGLYLDYRAKQDIINAVFDLHKFDIDSTVISSAPFQAYEKQFAECKCKYDEAMKEVQAQYIQSELQESGCRWEVDFSQSKMIITPL